MSSDLCPQCVSILKVVDEDYDDGGGDGNGEGDCDGDGDGDSYGLHPKVRLY